MSDEAAQKGGNPKAVPYDSLYNGLPVYAIPKLESLEVVHGTHTSPFSGESSLVNIGAMYLLGASSGACFGLARTARRLAAEPGIASKSPAIGENSIGEKIGENARRNSPVRLSARQVAARLWNGASPAAGGTARMLAVPTVAYSVLRSGIDAVVDEDDIPLPRQYVSGICAGFAGSLYGAVGQGGGPRTAIVAGLVGVGIVNGLAWARGAFGLDG